MRQYHAIKTRYPQALVLFRLGDFYELFHEDAIVASRELQITLTSPEPGTRNSRSRCARSLPCSRNVHRAADSRGL